MENKLPIIASALILALAIWMNPDFLEGESESAPDAPAVVTIEKAAPSVPAVRAVESPQKRTPLIELSKYKQNSEIAEPLPEAPYEATLSGRGRNAPGNDGPYDASGNLIIPIDRTRGN